MVSQLAVQRQGQAVIVAAIAWGAAITSGPRIGDLESGAVANAFGDTTSVVSGGLACIVGALLLARALPGFRRQLAPASGSPELASAHRAEPVHAESSDSPE